MDGHHRWLANYYSGRPTNCCVVDLPILELMRVAKEHTGSLNENLTHKEFKPMMDGFVKYVSDDLGIKNIPSIRFKDVNDDFASFGGYNPSDKSIVIDTKNRHPMDIFRTLAHELVHAKQDEDGKIKDVSKEGETGSKVENEANAKAGIHMRNFGRANPDMFKQSSLVEEEEKQEPLDFDKHFGKTFRITEPEGDSKRSGFSIVTPENGNAWSGPNAWKDRHKEGDTDYVDIARKNFNQPGWLGHKHGQITRSAKQLGLNEQRTAIFVVGVPCSGKDSVIRNLQESLMEVNYYQEIDIQTLEKKRQLAENIIVSASANNYDSVVRAKSHLENLGYMTEMIFVDVSNQISKFRNEQREARGQRVIKESIRFSKYTESKNNLTLFEELFDNVYLVLNEEGLHQWFKSRSEDGKRGWVQIGGRYEGKPCARQPGQTTTPKCRSSSEAARMTKAEKKYAFNKKQREDKNQPKKTGAAKPTMVKTYKENKKMNEEKDACYRKVKARYDVWPSAYASGALVKCRKVGAANWGKKSVKEAKNVNRENQITDIDLQFAKFVEDTAELNTYKREEGTKALADLYRKGTPGQWYEEDCGCEKNKTEEKVVADDIGGPTTLRNPLSEKKKIIRKKRIEEDGVLDTASGAVGLPVSDSIGAEFGVAKSPSLIGGLVGVSSPVSGMGPAGSLYPFGTYGISESLSNWANKPETIERYRKKYGKLAEQKLLETVKVISESIEETEQMPKTIRQIRENWEGRAGRDMGTVFYSHAEDKVNEASPAWQRKEGKNPEGGLNRKGVESYRRENPGSKLQTAVTTDPSKLKPGSKKAKRRLSFCRRMKGMKAKLTSAKTARDPDSRINKSLRKWNCE